MVERSQGGRAAAGRRREAAWGPAFSLAGRSEAGREEAEAGRAGRAGGRAEGGDWRSRGTSAAAGGAERKGGPSAPCAARAPRPRRAPGLGSGPAAPPLRQPARPGQRAQPFSFHFLLHYVWAEMRGQALVRAAAATAPPDSPGRPRCDRRPPRGPRRRGGARDSAGRWAPPGRRAAPPAASGRQGPAPGPPAQTPRRGPARIRGHFLSSLFLSCRRPPTPLGHYILASRERRRVGVTKANFYFLPGVAARRHRRAPKR